MIMPISAPGIGRIIELPLAPAVWQGLTTAGRLAGSGLDL